MYCMKSIKSLSNVIQNEINKNINFKFNYIKSNWDKIIGDNLSLKTSPNFIKNGIIYITVANSAWLQELNFLRFKLIKNINEFISEEFIENAKFKVGIIKNETNMYEGKQNIDISKEIESISLNREDIRRIKENIKFIEDNDLKFKLYNIISKNIKREKYLLNTTYKKCKNCGILYNGNGNICYLCKSDYREKFHKNIYYAILNNPKKTFYEFKQLYPDIDSELYDKLKIKVIDHIDNKIDGLLLEKMYNKVYIYAYKYVILTKNIYDNDKIEVEIENLIDKRLEKIKKDKINEERYKKSFM